MPKRSECFLFKTIYHLVKKYERRAKCGMAPGVDTSPAPEGTDHPSKVPRTGMNGGGDQDMTKGQGGAN